MNIPPEDFWTLWKALQTSLVKHKALEEGFKRDEDERGKAKRRKVSKRNESKLGRRLPSRPQAGTSTRYF